MCAHTHTHTHICVCPSLIEKRLKVPVWQDNVPLAGDAIVSVNIVDAPILRALDQKRVINARLEIYRDMRLCVCVCVCYSEKHHSNSPATLPQREMSSIIYSSLSRIVIRVLHSPGSCLLGCNLPISINTTINSNVQYSKIQIPWDTYTKNVLVNKQMCICVCFSLMEMCNVSIQSHPDEYKHNQRLIIKHRHVINSLCGWTWCSHCVIFDPTPARKPRFHINNTTPNENVIRLKWIWSKFPNYSLVKLIRV